MERSSMLALLVRALLNTGFPACSPDTAKNTTLSRMYDKSLHRRERFSESLAELLKGKLPSPLDDEIVCHPALVISEMWGEP